MSRFFVLLSLLRADPYQDDSKELNAFASSFAPSVPKGFSDKSSSPDQSSMQPVLSFGSAWVRLKIRVPWGANGPNMYHFLCWTIHLEGWKHLVPTIVWPPNEGLLSSAHRAATSLPCVNELERAGMGTLNLDFAIPCRFLMQLCCSIFLRWSSGTKLAPSCEEEAGRLVCQSVPKGKGTATREETEANLMDWT